MKKKASLIALFLVLCLVMTACGSSAAPAAAPAATTAPAESAAPAAKILTVQVGPDPETLDPALNSAVDGGNMLLHLYECLLTVDQAGAIAPGAAETWECSEDGLTWTFHLRDGLKWSDGSDLTAQDFVYSWQRVADPATAAPYADTVLSFVENFEANGDSWAVKPETYISNGPFMITEWVPGSHILTSANPNYWNKDAVKLDGIKWLLIEDSNASYSAYQTGEALMIKDVPTEEVPSLKGNPEFHVDPILGTYYLNLNCNVDAFKDANVRKAMSLAIDRAYVANTLMQGTYLPAWNFMGPGWADPAGGDFMSNANGGKPYISEDYEANLAQAVELMKAAGYKADPENPDLKITYSTNDSGYHKVVAEYLQEAWKQIGIDVSVEIVEWASFTPMRRAGDYQAARNGWVGDYSDPSNMIELLYSTNGNNDGKYNNPDFDAAIDASRSTMDVKERSAALHQAEDIIMDTAGCVPVAYYTDFYLQSSKIVGSWHSPYGYWFFMFADIAE